MAFRWDGRLLDLAFAQQLERDAYRLTQLNDTLLRRLPVSEEPAAVYALRARLGSDDTHAASVGLPDGTSLWVVYIGSIVDRARLYDEVLRPLQECARRGELPPAGHGDRLLPAAQPVSGLAEWASALLLGRAVIFAPSAVVAVEVEAFPTRPVSEPSTEQSVLGPKEAFTESLETNLGLVRRIIHDDALRIEVLTVGRRSRTKVALVYLGDVVNPELLELTRQGIADIDTDFIRTSNELSEYLFSGSWTTFPLAEQTERPSRAAAEVMNGCLCVVVDGSPFVLVLPTAFIDVSKDSEVALPGPIVTAFVRTLRFMGMFIAVSAAGLYAALLTADTALLPTPLALAVATSRNGIPYPVLTEVLIMLLVIDVFSEATSQAPGGVGKTLSIVGTLIIGQMAVSARLASSLMMIVVAVTALGAFLTLKYPVSYALRIWKYPIAVLGGLAGLFGWMAGLTLLAFHLASLKSAGVPYLSPLGPLSMRSLFRSGITRVPRPQLETRLDIWDPQQLGSGKGQP